MDLQQAYKRMAAQLDNIMRKLTDNRKRQALEWALGWTPVSGSVTRARLADNAISEGEPLDK